MRLSRWMGLIGIVILFGCLKVGERNALYFKGYAVGDRLQRIHAQETGVAWLNAEVTEMVSPVRLAQTAQDRKLKLIAWSTLSPDRAALVARQAMAEGPSGIEPTLNQVAALDSAQQVGDTAD
jgi:hypothetical protein